MDLPQHPMTSIEEVLDSLQFRQLWNSMSESYIPWERFRLLPMPEGLDADQVWRIIEGLRKGMGTTFEYPPWFPFDPDCDLWFCTTKESESYLRQIATQAFGGSNVARGIAKLDGYYFSQYLLMNEMIAICADDGLTVDPKRARRMAFHAAAPETDAERLYENLCSIFSDTARFEGREITHGLIEEIQRLLLEGIEATPPHIGPIKMADSTYYTPERTLDLICRLGRCEGANGALHPILAYIEIMRMFWDLRPLPCLDSCTELVIRRVFFTRYGFPNCAFFELALMDRRFETEAGKRYGFAMHDVGYPDEYRLFGIDGTFYHETFLKGCVAELEQLEHKVDRFTIKRARQKEQVRAIKGLNAREQDVILNLLRNPLERITIEQHRDRHHIAYATAHDDLTHLEKLGYLKMEKDCRRFSYSVGRKLIELT